MLGVAGSRRLESITPQNVQTTKAGAGKSALTSVEVQKTLQIQEDNYADIIYKLQHDRLALRGRNITERLNKMSKQDTGLNAFIKEHNEKNEMKVKLSRESENLLTKAVENVDSLRQNVKMQMAQVKVISLKQKQEFMLRAQQLERQAEKEAKTSVFKKN